jgi:hypothetical protein
VLDTVMMVGWIVILALPALMVCLQCRSDRVLVSLGVVALVAAGLCLWWAIGLRAGPRTEECVAVSFFGSVFLINGIMLLLGPVLRRVRLR